MCPSGATKCKFFQIASKRQGYGNVTSYSDWHIMTFLFYVNGYGKLKALGSGYEADNNHTKYRKLRYIQVHILFTFMLYINYCNSQIYTEWHHTTLFFIYNS